jgi:hypothetical protein
MLMETTNRHDELRVAFEYEEAPLPRFSVLEFLGRVAEARMQHAPESLPHTSIFQSSKAVDWFSGVTLSGSSPLFESLARAKTKRLRAITLDSKPLLEHSYAADGYRSETRYSDGVTVNYGWDDRSRSTRIWTSEGQETTIQFRSDDSIESILYDGNARFQYDYAPNGNVTDLTYPDGARLQRSFGKDGRLAKVVCGTASVVCRWSSDGSLAGYEVQGGVDSARFVSNKERFECHLASSAGRAYAPPRSAVNPFGVWQFAADGYLEALLAPWGDRLLCRRSEQGLPLAACGLRGMRRFDFGGGRTLCSMIAENGLRLCFHAVPKTSKVVLVAPESVMLFEYDEKRRLLKSRRPDGDYSAYKWKPSGIQQIENPLGKTALAHDATGHLLSASFATGGACEFHYGGDSRLSSMTATGQLGLGAALSQTIVMFCWAWFAMRSTLRLKTEAK